MLRKAKNLTKIDSTMPEICTGCQRYGIAITLTYGASSLSAFGASKPFALLHVNTHRRLPRGCTATVASGWECNHSAGMVFWMCLEAPKADKELAP